MQNGHLTIKLHFLWNEYQSIVVVILLWVRIQQRNFTSRLFNHSSLKKNPRKNQENYR